MAKIKSPLCSVSASGSIAGRITYRATRAGAVAQSPAIPTGAATDAQAYQRQRMRDARAAWNALDAALLAEWEALGAARDLNPWPIFFQEYLVQDCSGVRLPIVPADPF